MDTRIYSLRTYRNSPKGTYGFPQISRNALAGALDTLFEVIDKWYMGNIEKIDADILARICFALKCAPEDLIIYKKDKPVMRSLPCVLW